MHCMNSVIEGAKEGTEAIVAAIQIDPEKVRWLVMRWFAGG